MLKKIKEAVGECRDHGIGRGWLSDSDLVDALNHLEDLKMALEEERARREHYSNPAYKLPLFVLEKKMVAARKMGEDLTFPEDEFSKYEDAIFSGDRFSKADGSVNFLFGGIVVRMEENNAAV